MSPDKQEEGQGQPDSSFRTSSINAYKIVFSFTRPAHLLFLTPAILFAAIAGTIKPITSILTGKFFNSISQYAGGSIDGIQTWNDAKFTVYAFVVLGVSTLVIKAAFFAAWTTYGELQARAVREELFTALLVRELEWFEAQAAGVNSLLSRIQTQIREFQLGVSQPLGFVALSVVQSTSSAVIAFRYSWKLTLVILATFPFIAGGISFLSRGLSEAVEGQHKMLTAATKEAGHSINNIVLVKCHNTQIKEVNAYLNQLEALRIYGGKQARIVAYQTAFIRLTATCLLALALFYGTILVHHNQANPGKIMTAFWCSVTATRGFNEILNQMLVLEKGRAAASSLRNLIGRIERAQRLRESSYCHIPISLEGDIEFRNVEFAYPSRPDQQVLDDITFFFPAHETTFVVGKSGSGKSTLSNLLLKFYKTTTGRISIDGINVQKIDSNWLRNNITMVQQESILFNGTIIDNVKICLEHGAQLDSSQLSVCLDFSDLDRTVRDLPKGVNTTVGKGGTTLSGGQRQRIALARARLRDAPILILDESTSALDKATKIQINKNIREWRQNKTTIFITHDLSQIGAGDFVYVLKDGKVVTEGYRPGVQAELKHTLDFDMIGSTSEPNQIEFGQRRWRDQLGLRTIPTRRYSETSISSFGTGASDDTAGESSTLLTTSTALRKTAKTSRFTMQTLLHANRGHKRHRQQENNQPFGEMLDPEIELSQISRSRTLYNRLTMAPGARPFSTHPTLAFQSTYDHNNIRELPNTRPITIWDHVTQITGQRDVVHDPMTTISSENPTSAQSYSLRGILCTIWPNLNIQNRQRLIFAFLITVLYAAVPSVSAWVSVHLFQNFHLQTGWVEHSRKWSLILLATGILESVSAFTIHFLFETLGQTWTNSLRCRALSQVILQPKQWFDDQHFSSSDILTTLDRGAEEMHALLGRLLSFVLIAIVMVSIAVVWSMITCWKLTLVTLACGLLVYASTKLFSVVSKRWESHTNDAAQEIADVFAESFSDVRTVRALTLESRFHKKYLAATSKAFTTGINRGLFTGLCFGASDSSILFITACVFCYGVSLAVSSEFSTEAVLTVLTLLLFAMTSVSNIIGYIPQLSGSVDAGNRLLRLTNLPLPSHERQGFVKLKREDFTGEIIFSNVSFTYPGRPAATILNKFDLKIPAGQFIAIVGRSGSGKSTIISLILGLYAVCPDSDLTPSSQLRISSHNILNLDLTTLRNFIAYVPQQPVLFHMSIRQNILYGLDTAKAMWTADDGEAAASVSASSEEEHQQLTHSAARSAEIHDFITSLPAGYDTVVGEGGSGVSGGQAQRIVLARAFARRPKILLLDEPTSALDDESAAAIRRTLWGLTRSEGEKPTIVVVTHAREMMQLADRVVLVEDGTVVEDGTFESLMARRARLWRLLNGESE